MTSSVSSVLVLGGGVAGMAAARTLADQDVPVHLVESSDRLGGHAASWACMATDTCQNCGACLAHDMADQVCRHPNIHVYLNTSITALDRTDQGFVTHLDPGDTLRADRIIMATGFSPFDPAALPSLDPGPQSRVITTARLNQMLKDETLTDFLGNTTAPDIAFIQCVGSRNRHLQRDFCSQICCKVSLRHAGKLMHLLPNAAITLFHMDLQVIGKESRCLAQRVSSGINLLQGMPAEIRQDPKTGRLGIVTEEPGTRSRKARFFDLVVLSVGMAPSSQLEDLAARLGISPNPWGFFNTPDAALTHGVYTAGCAAGPKDIAGSIQEGATVGAKVLTDLGHAQDKRTDILVWGEGRQAVDIASTLAQKGYQTTCFGRKPDKQNHSPKIAFTDPGRILSVDGTAGHFTVRYDTGGWHGTLTCNAIIAAPDTAYNHPAGTGKLARATDLEAFSQTPEDQLPETSVILLDTTGPENKTTARQALAVAAAVRNADRQVFVIMNKMLVHGALGQQLYDQARKSGVRFLRVDSPADIQIQSTDKGFSLTFDEATLPGLPMSLSCDCLVVPSVPVPGPDFPGIADLLKQTLDKEGFLQSANVRHRLTQSPRKGIFFAGPCHDEVDDTDLAAELAHITGALGFTAPAQDHGVAVNQKKCAQCLTCLRICPHSAIMINDEARPEIMADACFGCHLCVANCPAFAIESEEFSTDQVAGQARKGQIAVLACRRSAALAAGPLELPERIRLIPVPCACRISPDLILKTLLNGTDKVVVAGCHEENCQSMDGTRTARTEVARLQAMPGIPSGRVTWHPVAANETRTFARIIAEAQISQGH